MGQLRRTRVTKVPHMKFNEDDAISMYDSDEECIIQLPTAALKMMIQFYENILCDLEEKNDRLRRYWYQPGTDIYSSSKFDQIHSKDDQMVPVRNLYVRQLLLEMILSADAFQSTILTAIILLRHREKQLLNKFPYKLNSLKTVVFDLSDDKFFIFDSKMNVKLVLPIRALAIMIAKKKKILNDLRANDDDETPYWQEDDFVMKPCKPLLMLTTGKDGSPKILLNENAFRTMLDVALTAGKTAVGEFRARYTGTLPINSVKSIKFSDDNKDFTLIDELNCVALNLPMTALDAMRRLETQILSDLDKEILLTSTCDSDYINEYWSNGKYTLRTTLFLNVYSEVNCNVVSVVESATNTVKFVIQEKAFREISDLYRDRCAIKVEDCDVKI